MKKITVTLQVDESALKAESSMDNLEEAINRELGWLHESGMYAESWSFSEPQQEAAKVSCLCEEYESDDGIREFSICAVSADKNQLRRLLAAKIQADEYGFIKEKGVETNDPDHFCTNFEDGFVEYYIRDVEVLSREALDMQIQAELGKAAPEPAKVPLAEQIAKAEAALEPKAPDLEGKEKEQERE